MARAEAVARRSILVGALGASLTACGRSDPLEVADALDEAVAALPEYIAGDFHVTDNVSAGTHIEADLALVGETPDEVGASLTVVLETVIRTYREQANTRTADVGISGHSAGSRRYQEPADNVVHTSDVIRSVSGSNIVTTDDLEEHFGL